MIATIASIVEGHGDVAAVPILLRRLAREAGLPTVNAPRPIRIPKTKLVRPDGTVNDDELGRAVLLAASRLPDPGTGGVLVLLDADDSCPAVIAPRILEAARAARSDVAIAVVLAKREYEAWFLAAVESLKLVECLSANAARPDDPESVADPKRLLSRHARRGRSYSETVDQPAFTARFDLTEAAACPSFLKLRREVVALLGGASGAVVRTRPGRRDAEGRHRPRRPPDTAAAPR